MQQIFQINSDELRTAIKEIVSEEMTTLFKEYAKEPKVLTREEAAEIIKVGTNTISRWVKSGLLKNRGKGRKILLYDTDIMRLPSYSLKYKRSK